MSIDWAINSQVFASLNISKPQGNKGLGFYQLIFPIKITMHNIPKEFTTTVTNISGTLRVQGIGSQSSPTLLGRLIQQGATRPITTYEYVSDNHTSLEVELDAKRIEAIEQIRLGGDLTFSIDLYATANRGGSIEQLYRQPYQLAINQSDWIKVLESIDYQKTLLLEIPVPIGETNLAFTEAAKHLETAQKQMLLGHYREAVSACRDVLESMNHFSNDVGEPAPTSKRKRNKIERFSAIRISLQDLTNAAKHADETANLIEWNLADARASISMAATLLLWANEEYCS